MRQFVMHPKPHIVATSLALLFTLFAFAQNPQPKADEKLSPAASRQATQRYLTSKVGNVPISSLPQGGPASWCSKQYDAAVKSKDVQTTYRLISSHLQRANQLLSTKERANHSIGLAMAMAATTCAIDRLKDRALALWIVDGYLLGCLDQADFSDQSYVGKENLLTVACAIYLKAGHTEKYAAAYEILLQHALSKDDDNTADAARLKLADAMLKLNQPEKAKDYLDAIKPNSSLAGGASKLLPKILAALKGKKQ